MTEVFKVHLESLVSFNGFAEDGEKDLLVSCDGEEHAGSQVALGVSTEQAAEVVHQVAPLGDVNR